MSGEQQKKRSVVRPQVECHLVLTRLFYPAQAVGESLELTNLNSAIGGSAGVVGSSEEDKRSWNTLAY